MPTSKNLRKSLKSIKELRKDTKFSKKKVHKVSPISALEANILIIYTGGTIGMLYKETEGLIPVKGNLIKLIKELDIPKFMRVKCKIDAMHPLIDSSNLKTDDWKKILEKLYDNYNKYTSFIIIHGTDTLAYTASALSYFLRSWNKTVVVTGSQIPLFEFRNDAVRNIKDSIIVSLFSIPEVLIVFGGKILRGNCTSKLLACVKLN